MSRNHTWMQTSLEVQKKMAAGGSMESIPVSTEQTYNIMNYTNNTTY